MQIEPKDRQHARQQMHSHSGMVITYGRVARSRSVLRPQQIRNGLTEGEALRAPAEYGKSTERIVNNLLGWGVNGWHPCFCRVGGKYENYRNDKTGYRTNNREHSGRAAVVCRPSAR